MDRLTIPSGEFRGIDFDLSGLTDEQLDFLAANPESARGLRDAIYRGVDEGMTFKLPADLRD